MADIPDAKGLVSSPMIARPGARYLLFQCLNSLCLLKQAMEIRPLWEWDAAPLIETLEVINGTVTAEPNQLVGEVFFDQEEVVAIRFFQELPIEFDSLYAEWAIVEKYLRSREWQTVLNAAEDCLQVMFRPGRGLPGWETIDDK